MDPDTFRLLQEADWGAIGKRLLAFAEWRAGNYEWRRGNWPELAQGKTTEDVVQEVIVKALTGVRKWDPDRGELEPWLKDQVKSVIDALAKSAPHRRERGIPEGENGVELIDRMKHRTGAHQLTPEEAMLREEAVEEVKEKVDALFQSVAGEPDLEEVLQAIIDGCEPKPRYIAAELEVPVKDINNRLKRIRRRALRGVV